MSGHKTQEGLDLDQIADYEVLGYLVVFALQAAFFESQLSLKMKQTPQTHIIHACCL